MSTSSRNKVATTPLHSIAGAVSSLSKSGTPAQVDAARRAHDAQRQLLRLRDLYAADPTLVPAAPAQIATLRKKTIDLMRPPTGMASWDRYYALLDVIEHEQASYPTTEGATS